MVKLSKSEKGITIIEILVVIVIIVLFSGILIADFPKIRRQLAISRAVNKMSENVRTTQDMALSGAQIYDAEGNDIKAKGYGVYINISNNKEYLLYADMDNNHQYESGEDFLIKKIDFSKSEPGVIIKEILNVNSGWTSIDFSPPNPNIRIANLTSGQNRIQIVFQLENDPLNIRSVFVNTVGLIEIK